MKILALISCLLIGIESGAQRNSIKLNLFGVVTGRLSAFYERSLNKNFSLSVGIERATYFEDSHHSEKLYSLSGFGAVSEFRVYPFTAKKNAPLGFFAGAGVRYGKFKEAYHEGDIYIDGNLLNYGPIIGYKLNSENFIIEVLGGYGTGHINNFDYDRHLQIDPFYSNRQTQYDLKNFLRLEISFGFVFPYY